MHTFRVVPVDGDGSHTGAAPLESPVAATASSSTTGEIEVLRAELVEAREAIGRAGAVESSLREEIDQLHDQLDQTLTTIAEEEPRNGLRDEEVSFLRDQLDRARAEFETEARKRRESTALFAARTSEHALLLAAREDEHAEAIAALQEQFDRLRQEAQSAEARRFAHADETRTLIDELHHQVASAEARLQDFDATRADRDRLTEERDELRLQLENAQSHSHEWNYDRTELEIPRALDPLVEANPLAIEPEPEPEPESETLFDVYDLRPLVEPDHARDRQAEDLRLEVEALRFEIEKARVSLLAASRANFELTARIEMLEAAPEAPEIPVAVASGKFPVVSAIDPALVKRAVDEALQGAWADFERRLSDTQTRLKAANARADLLETEAREARQQIAAREAGSDFADGSSFEANSSMTSIRILNDRGIARITPADAEARLALAKQMAVDRKDKSLIDRINRMAEKVHVDLQNRNYTLAETLVRGAEIETGLDVGGYSINGLRIFRPSPTIVASLDALAPAIDRVMRQGDLATIRSTIEEMRTILGDQAGLPELRRQGRSPAIKRPIAIIDALQLFFGVLDGEGWLIRPIATKRPLPDTSLTTYAAWVEAGCLVRSLTSSLLPARLAMLDEVIVGACTMLTRRQQPDGHFAFLDPRGKPSKASSVVEAMVSQRPDAVKDGWVVQVDPAGLAQSETGACALALMSVAKTLGRPDLSQAAQKAADWAMNQPGLANFASNAASTSLLARAYLISQQDRHLTGLVRKLTTAVLPGQVENGRWIDACSATTSSHLTILRALHDAWEAIPVGRQDLRQDLKPSIDRAIASLLEECQALGAPAQGQALRDLIRHRDLFPAEAEAEAGTQSDPRLASAILDSVTVIQELCHDGSRLKLGVAPDQLAALTGSLES